MNLAPAHTERDAEQQNLDLVKKLINPNLDPSAKRELLERLNLVADQQIDPEFLFKAKTAQELEHTTFSKEQGSDKRNMTVRERIELELEQQKQQSPQPMQPVVDQMTALRAAMQREQLEQMALLP